MCEVGLFTSFEKNMKKHKYHHDMYLLIYIFQDCDRLEYYDEETLLNGACIIYVRGSVS